jgi:hypothetical protein
MAVPRSANHGGIFFERTTEQILLLPRLRVGHQRHWRDAGRWHCWQWSWDGQYVFIKCGGKKKT